MARPRLTVSRLAAVLAAMLVFGPLCAAAAGQAAGPGPTSIDEDGFGSAAGLSEWRSRAAIGGSDGDRFDANASAVSIVGVYPNPVAARDRGEFILVHVPPDSAIGAYRLADEQGSVALPNVTAGGPVAVAWHPALVRNLTDARVVAVEGSLGLANGGERLRLLRQGESVASVRYREAPEGELARFDSDGTVTWHPLGRTDRPVVSATGGTARAFVLPDAPSVPLETVQTADERVLLAGYTFTSRRVARALEAAADRGIDVRVLLEGEPVDGISSREAALLDSLVAAGVDVRLLGGPSARYAYHHAKYAIVDGRAVVLTENWKPAGTGGHSSRGWGVVVSQRPVVEGLAATFRADANWTAAHPWPEFRRGRSFERVGTANGSYEQRHDPEQVAVDRVALLVTPDNGAGRVTEVIESADESVAIVQMRIGSPDQRFVHATVEAARRGVDVRILLSSAWYVREDNRRFVEHLRERARTEDLPLEARLAEPGGRFEKIHAKGMVVDGERVLIGSLNWNGESLRQNREVLLLVEGEALGAYYQEVFDADWRGHRGTGSPVGGLPLGSLAAVLGSVVIAIMVLRRVEFGEDVGVEP
jgi:phosphatidylserine/phosphatidylglycerophosphate/cardiolipin synthase-like enzyme